MLKSGWSVKQQKEIFQKITDSEWREDENGPKYDKIRELKKWEGFVHKYH